MSTQRSWLLIASALVISIFFNSVVYACSKLDPMAMPLQVSSGGSMNGMNERTIERGPCAEHKQDICKSVRERMLSIQPSIFKAEDAKPVLVLLLPLLPETTDQVVFSAEPFERKIFYHPVFKLSLPFSYLVLRV